VSWLYTTYHLVSLDAYPPTVVDIFVGLPLRASVGADRFRFSTQTHGSRQVNGHLMKGPGEQKRVLVVLFSPRTSTTRPRCIPADPLFVFSSCALLYYPRSPALTSPICAMRFDAATPTDAPSGPVPMDKAGRKEREKRSNKPRPKYFACTHCDAIFDRPSALNLVRPSRPLIKAAPARPPSLQPTGEGVHGASMAPALTNFVLNFAAAPSPMCIG
jgi:hypothetical protein